MIIKAKFRTEPIADPVNDQQKYGLDSILILLSEIEPELRLYQTTAISKSLKHIQYNINGYIFWSYSFSKYKGKTLGVFSTPFQAGDIYSEFKCIELLKKHTHEFTSLEDWLQSDYSMFDFWWDTKANFMCWKEEEDVYKIEDWHSPKLVFESKFKKVIKYKG